MDKPKIRPSTESWMLENFGYALDIVIDAVNIKATTSEGVWVSYGLWAIAWSRY